MVIDFIFEKGIQPWDCVEVKIGQTINSMVLDRIAPNIGRIQLVEPSGTVKFIKNDIWTNGIEELFFSTDGIFYNAFSADRLPFSFEISVNPDVENKTIHVLGENYCISSTSKSQNRWKRAVFIQSVVFIFLLLFLMFTFICVFNEQWPIIMGIGIIACLITAIITIKKSKRILSLIKSNAVTS